MTMTFNGVGVFIFSQGWSRYVSALLPSCGDKRVDLVKLVVAASKTQQPCGIFSSFNILKARRERERERVCVCVCVCVCV